jgi:hypothetical protein
LANWLQITIVGQGVGRALEVMELIDGVEELADIQ